MKKYLVCTLAILGIIVLVPADLEAQNKVQRCQHIQVGVDYQVSRGNWENGTITLKLQDQGQGWLTVDSNKANRVPIKAAKGDKFRLNFNDGQHPVTVKATGGSNLKVAKGAMDATVIVDILGSSGNGAVQFEITGSPSQNAKINGCPGGNVYFRIVG